MRTLHDLLLDDPTFVVNAPRPERSVDEKRISVDQCLALPEVMSFAWTSDVQIRQREAKLYGKYLSSRLDWVVNSFERDDIEEEYDWAVYESVIAAFDKINKGHELDLHDGNGYLRFLIHTGDSVDAGFVQELWDFLGITNTSRMPWFNVVGNHDGSVFGNYLKEFTYTREAFSDFFPVANLRSFIGMHGADPASATQFKDVLPRPYGMDKDETLTGDVTLTARNEDESFATLDSTPPSDCHGFDLSGTEKNGVPCVDQKGYYHFEIDPGFVVVVLESARLSSWGEWAKWDKGDESKTTREQLDWLRFTLDSYRGKNILIFTHHRMNEASKELRSIIDAASTTNAVAVFTGHTHDDDLTAYPNYYDINLASIISFPQMGRVIEFRRSEDGARGCIVSKPVSTSVFDQAYQAAYGSAANYKAKLAACALEKRRTFIRDQDAATKVPECEGAASATPKCKRYLADLLDGMHKAIECGHLGAIRDKLNRSGHIPRLEPNVTSVVIPFDIPRSGR